MRSRILIVDDHVAVQRGIRDILSSNLEEVEIGLATNPQQAIECARRERWDVAILDLSLPGRGGLELIRPLKDEQPGIRVLIYSMYSEEQFGVRALRAGAAGYLSKDSDADEIPRAVRSVLETGRYIGPGLAAAMAQNLNDGSMDRADLLSGRELEVLRCIASGKTPTEIAEKLAVSIKTVSTYRARILEKLNLKTTADLVRYAIEKEIGG